MRTHLKIGKMNGAFYMTLFGWDEAELQDAIERANDARQRANITPTEILSPIRFEKGTQSWTQGAQKRLRAEEDLVERSITTDRLFCLPHQKNDWLKPLWFKRDMTFSGRAAETVYDFPTITQKFFRYARDCRKETLKRETSVETRVTGGIKTPSMKSSSSELTKKRGTSPLSRNGKVARKSLDGERFSHATAKGLQNGDSLARPVSQPSNAIVHVGWIRRQDDDSFVLEKDFRSLRTWLAGPDQLSYDYDKVRISLGMTQDPQLRLFWFEDIAGEPWVVKSDHAIAGAIERMHSKGNICFLLARDIEHVYALTPSQRGERATDILTQALPTNARTEIENQTVQTLTLDLQPAEDPYQQDQVHRDVAHQQARYPSRRTAKHPYMIPSISVSLARILGEQVMRSRIE